MVIGLCYIREPECPTIEFHQIRYFLALCDHLNFTRAADASGVSQPALTKAIQKLEDELGGVLFIRGSGHVALTDLGRVMRTHFEKIQDTREAAHQAARSMIDLDMVELDIGIMCTVGPTVIGPALSEFQKANSGVELLLHDVWSKRGHELLLGGALDCAIMGRHEPLPDKFEAVELFKESFVLAMATDHPLATKNEILLADLAGCAYADRLRCEFRETFTDMLAERAFSVETVIRSEREDWIQTAIMQGHGIAMMPLYSVTNSGIVTREVEDLTIERSVEVVTVRDRPIAPALTEFLDFLQTYAWTSTTRDAA